MEENNEVWIHIDCASRKNVANIGVLNSDAFVPLVRLDNLNVQRICRKQGRDYWLWNGDHSMRCDRNDELFRDLFRILVEYFEEMNRFDWSN